MSGIAKLSEKMKKKLSFDDYALSPPLSVAPPIPAPVIMEQQALPTTPIVEQESPTPVSVARKIYMISNDDAQKLQEIFSRRASSSIAEIMSEAIVQLHQKEIIVSP